MSAYLEHSRQSCHFAVSDEELMSGTERGEPVMMAPESLRLTVEDGRYVTVTVWGNVEPTGGCGHATFSNLGTGGDRPLKELPDWAMQVVRMHVRAVRLTDQQAEILGGVLNALDFSGWTQTRDIAASVMLVNAVRERQNPL